MATKQAAERQRRPEEREAALMQENINAFGSPGRLLTDDKRRFRQDLWQAAVDEAFNRRPFACLGKEEIDRAFMNSCNRNIFETLNPGIPLETECDLHGNLVFETPISILNDAADRFVTDGSHNARARYLASLFQWITRLQHGARIKSFECVHQPRLSDLVLIQNCGSVFSAENENAHLVFFQQETLEMTLLRVFVAKEFKEYIEVLRFYTTILQRFFRLEDKEAA